jgi:hypothetical protein
MPGLRDPRIVGASWHWPAADAESPERQRGYRLLHGATLGVRFPKAKLNTLSTAAELVEHHPGCARVHGVVPIEPADRIERAILVVDTFILALDPVVIPDPIFGHGPIAAHSIDRRISPSVASVVTLRELASSNLHRS